VQLSHAREYLEDCQGCDEEDRRLEVLSRVIALGGDLSDEQRARLMEIADRCPVHRTLSGRLSIRSEMSQR
jgi:uncharacterized OsmC-like protein